MVKQAQENFPNLDKNDAIQQQANMVEGREARTGEGGGATGVVNGIKEKVSVRCFYVMSEKINN